MNFQPQGQVPSRNATGVWALVCGGREYRNRTWLYLVLDTLHSERRILRLITGGSRGADHLAEQWATENRVFNARYVADWKQHGRAAGPIRNQRMLDEERPNVVVAFPGGRGTADMVARAKAANVEVIEVHA